MHRQHLRDHPPGWEHRGAFGPFGGPWQRPFFPGHGPFGPHGPWQEEASEEAARLRDVSGQVMAAAQAASGGSSEQQARAAEVLADARRRLYAILAEADQPSA
jgi:hypothetical protein